jgi:hypothetical protein
MASEYHVTRMAARTALSLWQKTKWANLGRYYAIFGVNDAEIARMRLVGPGEPLKEGFE